MIRTQISLTEKQMALAKEEAAARGISLAELIRRALDDTLDDRARVRRRAAEAVGGFRSGHTDTSERHDEVLAEHW